MKTGPDAEPQGGTHAANTQPATPGAPIPAPLNYATPEAKRIRECVPRGPAAALAIAYSFGATLAVAIAAAVDVYLHVAPELPGSRLIDIRDRITPRFIYLALDGLAVFLFLRTEFYRVAVRRARFTLLLAAFGAGVLHIAVVSAVLEAPPLSRAGVHGIALIVVGFGFPVLAALWLGRRGSEPR